MRGILGVCLEMVVVRFGRGEQEVFGLLRAPVL